jgi:hypothetical protein
MTNIYLHVKKVKLHGWDFLGNGVVKAHILAGLDFDLLATCFKRLHLKI